MLSILRFDKQFTHKESIFLFSVVFAFVCSILDSQLVEWSTIPGHLDKESL